MTALSRAGPGLPMDWQMPSRSQASRKAPAVYSAALVGVEDDAGHLAAAHGHRRCQSAVGQLRVVVLAQGKPEDPAGGHVQDRGKVQLPSPVPIWVPSPNYFLLISRAGKSRCTRSGARQRPFPGRVAPRRRRLRLAARPCSRISAATVFSLTLHPAARKSAVIRGELYVARWASNSRRTSAASATWRAAPGGSLPSFHL